MNTKPIGNIKFFGKKIIGCEFIRIFEFDGTYIHGLVVVKFKLKVYSASIYMEG